MDENDIQRGADGDNATAGDGTVLRSQRLAKYPSPKNAANF